MSDLMVGTIGSPAYLSGDMQERLALIQRVESSAIDHLFIADHISFHTGLGMDGLINAATLAAMAPNTHIFIGVYLLALRHPVPVARQLSSLSLSAPGRITLGIGIGGEDRHEMEICGVNPARRGEQTNHAMRALRALMQGEPVSYDCDFFSFEDALIKPAPKPAIPLIVGGRSDKAIRRAALLGDGWLGVWCSADRFASVVQQIDDFAAAERDTTPEWQHGMQVWVGCGPSKEEARAHVASGMEDMYRIPFEKFERYSPYGSAEETAEFLSGYVDQGARVLNLAARGPSEEYCIDHIAKVTELLKSHHR